MGQSIKSAIGKYAGVVAVKLSNTKNIRVYSVAAVALIGVSLLLVSNAATFSIGVKPQSGGDCIQNISDSNASGGSAIQFCTAATSGSSSPGAHLPIQYNISDLTGTVRYVDDTGSDSATGTASAPYATLAKAVSASAANDTIVVYGGVYRGQRFVDITKDGLKIKAYPGQVPEFVDSTSITSGWTTEGSYKWISYNPLPLRQSQGVPFNDTANNQNLNSGTEKVGGVGRYADQAWINGNQLRQVGAKSYIADGRFWVDTVNKRLYMTATDAGKQNIEVSATNVTYNSKGYYYFIKTNAADISIEGIKVWRYSTLADQQGVIQVDKGSNNLKLTNVEMSDIPFIGIKLYWSDNVKFANITMSKVGWQTINSFQTDNFTLDSAYIHDADNFDEFTGSPASGALKTSQNRGTTVSNGKFDKNLSHTLWFDQSNINTTVANNTFDSNGDSSIFFEISDGLILANNYFRGYTGHKTVRAIGSGGVVAVNNTIVGGDAPFTLSADDRSRAGCNATSACQHYSSDVQARFTKPATLDWMPRLDMFLNNIVVNPTGNADLCGVLTVLCFRTTHGTEVSTPLQTEIHKADSSRGIPQTVIDGNVYANGSSALIRVTDPAASYSSLSAWTAALAGSPVGIAGLDANSKSGTTWVSADGTPTSALTSAHSQAIAVPTNAAINKWIPAGTKHYGVLDK